MRMFQTIGFLWLGLLFLAAPTWAQKREAVSAAEVTGTFRLPHAGKYKKYFNEIKIQALGSNKLQIAFDLILPKANDRGFNPNLGIGGGVAIIEGDTAVFDYKEYGTCKITFNFKKPGTMIVTQEGNDCGFGNGVYADGAYRKFGGKKPKFDANDL